MAIFAATDYKITFAGTNWSSYVTSVNLPITVAELETTAMGDSWTERIGGLKSFSLAVTFHQDFVDNGLDEVMWSAIGTNIAFAVAPTSATIGAGNPEYQGTVLVNAWEPIGASVGDLATVTVTWPGSGAIVRDVTP
jgi:hypothetical protein